MMVDDTESCSSRSVESSLYTRKQRYKLEVYHQVLRRIKDSLNKEARLLSFDDELWAHFNRLPIRYALDVNVERAEDVLMHRRLLELAHDPANRPAFDVRTVKVSPVCEVNTHVSFASSSYDCNMRAMHEITFATIDKPKLLNQLTSLLSEIGLNIQEAHAFSTSDGYSLDVFFVDGWPHEEIEQLKNALGRKILKMKKNAWFMSNFSSSSQENACAKGETVSGHIVIPTDGIDVWEIDYRKLKFETKIASGSSGDLFKGNYCSQDVAIKVLKPEALNVDMQQEFAQEVYIMRKVRHKNVVQFIGACTRPPSLCIVTEFMSGGSVYDYLHKQNGVFRPPSLLKVAIDASRGMNYLHQNNIIHRDLKAANLLMDENEVVKVADFGVARIKAQPGVMTAETGTYRWMAPEVIEHKPYDHKADVFSFGIVLWELLTGKVPYECLTPLQAAVGVVQRGLRPIIPDHTHPKVAHLLERCWQQDPTLRPDFSEIIDILQLIAKEVGSDVNEWRKEKSSGFLAKTYCNSKFWTLLPIRVKKEEKIGTMLGCSQ